MKDYLLIGKSISVRCSPNIAFMTKRQIILYFPFFFVASSNMGEQEDKNFSNASLISVRACDHGPQTQSANSMAPQSLHYWPKWTTFELNTDLTLEVSTIFVKLRITCAKIWGNSGVASVLFAVLVTINTWLLNKK